jgi:uncharacterized protein YceH (UPF0502 family)
VSFDLDSIEARVLGCLAEKDMATPEYYPLSLNALTNACNQKSNREPVVSYDDATVRTALSGLRDQGFAAFVSEAGSRVEKYKHRLNERFNFTRGELAVLCVLLLRGPQTGGELRQRTDRLHSFQDLDAVQHTLDKLASREPALVKQLERLPGTKEPRWAHLMSGEPVVEAGEVAAVTHVSPLAERVTQLEIELESLRAEFERFKAQF